MKKLILAFLFLPLASFSQDCPDLPEYYSSYDEAIYEVMGSFFPFDETLPSPHSSWIYSATYKSCDEEYGFLIIETGSKSYIHEDVPVWIWSGYKAAYSKGSYYHSNIKGRYQFKSLW